MAHTDPTEPLIDPQLKELLGKLRQTPARDERDAQHGRERFLAELDTFAERSQSSPSSWLLGWFRLKRRYSEDKPMNTRTKLVFTSLMAMIVLVIFLFGGVGATALAARSALPGDALYPVKTSLENTRVALAGSAYTQAQLNMRFAELRLDELNALVEEGRYGDIDQAAQQFEFHIQAALRSMQAVMAGDPALGAQLSAQINQALLGYAQALKATLLAVPPQARPPLERMILTSESESKSDDDKREDEMEFTGVVEAMGAASWTVSGQVINLSGNTEIKDSIQVGDTVKIHASQSSDGSLIAREIELEADDVIDDNENGNDDDDNMNGNDDDDDVNDNADDDNGNDDDGNGNDDDGNGNDDDDDNGNDDDGNGNDDDDGNGNDDDDDGNGNDNDDGNGNDDDDNGNDDDDDGNDDDDDGNSNDDDDGNGNDDDDGNGNDDDDD